jgi:hypothetical protein
MSHCAFFIAWEDDLTEPQAIFLKKKARLTCKPGDRPEVVIVVGIAEGDAAG